jgi:hypothetical protein
VQSGTEDSVLKPAVPSGGQRHNWIRLAVAVCLALVVVAAAGFAALAQNGPPPEPLHQPGPGATTPLTPDDVIRLFLEHSPNVRWASDIDGTVADFDPVPLNARPVAGVPQSFEQLGITPLSGRDTDFMVQFFKGDVFGGYGLVQVRDGEIIVHPELAAGQPALREAVQRLEQHPDIQASGAFVEVRTDNNGQTIIAIAVHWRRSADKAGCEAASAAGYDSEQIDRVLSFKPAPVDEGTKEAIKVYSTELAAALDRGEDPGSAITQARGAAGAAGLDVDRIEQALFPAGASDEEMALFVGVRHPYQQAFDEYVRTWEPKLRAAVHDVGADEKLGLADRYLNLVGELKLHLENPVDKGITLEQLVREKAVELLGLPEGGGDRPTDELLGELAAQGRPLLVIFNGDDTSDIPAFQMLQKLREQGAVTVAIAVRQDGMPLELLELADIVFDSPAEMAAFLKRTADAQSGAPSTGTDETDEKDGAKGAKGAKETNGNDDADGSANSTAAGDAAKAQQGEHPANGGEAPAADPFAAAKAATAELLGGETGRTWADGSTIDLLEQQLPVTKSDQNSEGNGQLGAQVAAPTHPDDSDDQQQRHDPVLSLAGRTPTPGGGGQQQPIQGQSHGSGQPPPWHPPGFRGQTGDPGPDDDPCLAALEATGHVPDYCLDLKDVKGGDDALLEAGLVLGHENDNPCLALDVTRNSAPSEDCSDLKGVKDDAPLDAGPVLGHEKDDRCLQPNPPADCLDVKPSPGDDQPLNMFQPGLARAHPEANGEDRRQGSAKGMATTAPPAAAEKDAPLVSGQLESVFTSPPASSPDLDKLFPQPSNQQPDPIVPAWPAPQLDGLQIPQVVPIIPGGGTSALPATNPWFNWDTQGLDQGAPETNMPQSPLDSLFPGAPDEAPYDKVVPPARPCDAACLAG